MRVPSHPAGTPAGGRACDHHAAALNRALIALAQEPDRRRGDLAAALAAAPRGLGAVAVDQGIAGVGYAHARHLKADFPDLLADLDAARRDAWINHRTTLADLGDVAAVLDRDGVPWAVVKGPVLVERAYGRPDLRSYYDLDLLIHPAAYGTALAGLEDAGVVLLDRNWKLIRASQRAELSLLVNQRTVVDLHWHLINEAPLRRRTSWDIPALLDRTLRARLGDVEVPVLGPADALVHLAVHACLSGGHRMVWLKDIERQCVSAPVDPASVEQAARAARLWPAVNLALLRTARTFDVAAPGRLTPWSRLNAMVGCDGFTVDAGAAGDGRTLGGATRPGVPSSVAAVAGTVLRDRLLPWGREKGLQRWLPPEPPTLEELRQPKGSRDDRDAYLRAAAATVDS